MSREEEGMAVPQTGLLPWHRESWRRLQGSIASGRLAHALLLCGPEGLGKSRFAETLAHGLLCTAPDQQGQACGQCQSCRLLRAGTHPDYTRIEPEEPGKAIRIDSIRDFTSREALTSPSGGYKVIIIEPADAMNSAAANSLLKTLEEPVARTLMVLISSNPARLPATIRSRCQRLQFTMPDRELAEQWLRPQVGANDPGLLLAFASGSPMRAVRLVQGDTLQIRAGVLQEFTDVMARRMEPLVVAARWSALDYPQLVAWLSGWLVDLIRLKMAPETVRLINKDQKERLQAMASALELKGLYKLLDKLLDATRAIGSQLNSQLILEDFLLTSVSIHIRKAG